MKRNDEAGIFPDRIIRSKRKTISLSVSRLGEVIVRAPLSTSEARIMAFVGEKQGWLAKQKNKINGAGIRLPQEDLNGYGFLLLGEKYTLTLYDGDNIRLDGENKRLFLPKKNTRLRLIKWLKENALRIFTAQMGVWAKNMGVTFQSVALSSAKTRWGTCSGENKIRYTYRLLYAPREVIDYVIVHELAHIKYKNHGKGFWALVESYLPDYKQHRKWLKERGALMEIF